MDHSTSAADLFHRLAGLYRDRYMDQSAFADALDTFISRLPVPAPRILDVGCGPGNISRYLLDRLPQAALTGIDLAPAMVDLARQANPTAHFTVMDCRQITRLSGPFHGIICGFCTPYLSSAETEQLIADAMQLLVPGGLLYLSTMEGPPERSGMQTSSTGDQLYIYYHEATVLIGAITRHGGELLYERRQPSPATSAPTPDTDLIIITRKGSSPTGDDQ